MLLKEIYEKKHYIFTKGPLDWREAMRQCCVPLEADGTVDPVYSNEIISCVEKHGPYIVLMPGVAMPHSTENAHGCNATAIGFMRCDTPVQFDSDEEGKYAQIFFTLCDTNPDEHLANMQRLYAILTNEEVVNRLINATSPEELLEIDAMVDEGKIDELQA